MRSVEVGSTAAGWFDPANVFADNDQITGLLLDLGELEVGPYPGPLP